MATANEDARLLTELKKLLREHGEKRELALVPPPLILPFWSIGYAVNGSGSVIGIKIGGSPGAQRALELIARFRHLERLVFHSAEDVYVPAAIGNLTNLRFLSLGGSVKRLPPEFLNLALDVYDAHAPDGQSQVMRRFDQLADAIRETKGTAAPVTLPPDDAEREADYERRDKENEEIIAAIWRDDAPNNGTVDLRLRREVLAACDESLRLRGLYLSGAELEDPPLEIAVKGRDAIERYFEDRRGGDLPLNEVKIILVGHGSAGKTSLVKRVFGDSFDQNEPQTHGINIRTWHCGVENNAEIKANFWDFGGQEIMHATHQFFLSKRSFYILLLDGRKEEDAEYWLQHIESFGGDSPILVVLNKIDEHPSFDVNRRFLKQKYPGIVDFCRISCATGLGIDSFTQRLRDEIGKVSILRTRWPANWFRVKQRLESLDTSYISLTDYNRICDEEAVRDPASRETLVDFLHDLGVILHFRDLHLLDTHVLDPLWVTEGVYKIINSEIVATQRGKLRLDQLSSVLTGGEDAVHRFPKDKHQYIVELMLKFELCYRLDMASILIPDLLDIQEPPLPLDRQGSLRFIFEYSYLPRSVIPRFIVRMHRDIKGQNLWRTGVMLADDALGATALVRADEKARRIYVSVTGGQKRDYFAIIRKVIADINSSFEKLAVTELVPLPDAPDIAIDYRELVGHEQAGRDDIFVGRLGRAYNVSSLLSGIEDVLRRDRLAHTVINVHGDYIATQKGGGETSLFNESAYERESMAYEPREWERMVTYATGATFLAVVGFLVIRNKPFADPNLVVLVRTVLSLIIAVFGATIPGMLRVDLTAKGVLIRAGGALALFVITFMLTPAVLPG